MPTQKPIETPEADRKEALLTVNFPFTLDEEMMEFFMECTDKRIDGKLNDILTAAVDGEVVTSTELDEAMALDNLSKAGVAVRVESDPKFTLDRLENEVLESEGITSLMVDEKPYASFDELLPSQRPGVVLATHASLFPDEGDASERTPYVNLIARVLLQADDHNLLEEGFDIDAMVEEAEASTFDGSSYELDNNIIQLMAFIERLDRREKRLTSGLDIGLVDENQVTDLMNESGISIDKVDAFALSVEAWADEVQSIMAMCSRNQEGVKDAVEVVKKA